MNLLAVRSLCNFAPQHYMAHHINSNRSSMIIVCVVFEFPCFGRLLQATFDAHGLKNAHRARCGLVNQVIVSAFKYLICRQSSVRYSWI